MRPIPTFTDPALSLWQSAIHAVILRNDPASATGLSADHPRMTQAVAAGQAMGGPTRGAPGAPAEAAADTYADFATRLAVAMWKGDQQEIDTLRDSFEYSQLDPLWLECLADYEAFVLEGKSIPYRTFDPARIATDFVLPLPATDSPELVVAVIGDWGTGTLEARQLLSSVAEHKPDVLIHLGDIYYAGTADECQNHFYNVVTAQFPGSNGPAIPTYTLSGNHDMYAGGAPYYQLLDQLGQPASFFCLRNDHWQLLAADTGLHDSDVHTVHTNLTSLEPSEAEWHRDKILTAGGRKTILLSHHQLFTALGGGVGSDDGGHALAVNPNLYQAFTTGGVSLGDVSLWLWGHEHNLVAYAPYAGLARGRCVGSGAIPVAAAVDVYAPNQNLLPPPGLDTLPDVDGRLRLGHDDEVYNRGYATITLSGPTAQVAYYQWIVDTGASELLYTEALD